MAVKVLITRDSFEAALEGEGEGLQLPDTVQRELRDEAMVLSRLRHPCCVLFYGICELPPAILTGARPARHPAAARPQGCACASASGAGACPVACADRYTCLPLAALQSTAAADPCTTSFRRPSGSRSWGRSLIGAAGWRWHATPLLGSTTCTHARPPCCTATVSCLRQGRAMGTAVACLPASLGLSCLSACTVPLGVQSRRPTCWWNGTGTASCPTLASQKCSPASSPRRPAGARP